MVYPKFYMVKGVGATTVCHLTYEAAHREVLRLTRLNPGVAFCILESKEMFIVEQPEPKRFLCA